MHTLIRLLASTLQAVLMPSFFGIGMGPSGQEKAQYNALSGDAAFAEGLGENSLAASAKFMQDVLSGDPTRISTALAPQISGIQQRTQQQKNEMSQFGTRSGGTAAAAAGLDSTARGDVTNLVGGLTNSAASGLASLGGNLFNTGVSARGTAFQEAKTMQDQVGAMWNDIFSSAASVAGGVMGGMGGMGMGISKIPAAAEISKSLDFGGGQNYGAQDASNSAYIDNMMYGG